MENIQEYNKRMLLVYLYGNYSELNQELREKYKYSYIFEKVYELLE